MTLLDSSTLMMEWHQPVWGETIFPTLWPIAAVDISTYQEVLDGKLIYSCPTDTEGLEKLISNGVDFLEHANDASLALSMVMTDEKHSEQIQQNLSELAWLQAGLMELVAQTTNSINKMRYVLKSNKVDK